MTKAMLQTIPEGSKVKIDQGHGRFTLGVVKGFDGVNKNKCGWVGNYTIEVTGGVNVFGKRAKVGSVHEVLHTHVSLT